MIKCRWYESAIQVSAWSSFPFSIFPKLGPNRKAFAWISCHLTFSIVWQWLPKAHLSFELLALVILLLHDWNFLISWPGAFFRKCHLWWFHHYNKKCMTDPPHLVNFNKYRWYIISVGIYVGFLIEWKIDNKNLSNNRHLLCPITWGICHPIFMHLVIKWSACIAFDMQSFPFSLD